MSTVGGPAVVHEGEALQSAARRVQGGISGLASKLGLTRSGMYYFFGKQKLDTDLKERAAKALGMSIEDIFKEKPTDLPLKETGDDIRNQKAFAGRLQKGVLAVPVKAQAGYARMLADDFRVFMSELDRMVIPNFPYDGDEFRAFEVEGDSMEYVNENGMIDGLPSGMWVVAQSVPPDDWAKNLSLYRVHVVVFAREILIKRILQDNEKEIILHSDNDAYPQERRSLKDVQEMWYVLRKLDWEMPPPRRIEITV